MRFLLDNIDKVIGKWSELVINRTNPYPVDGLVISYDDTAYAASGSVTGHHATRAAMRFKWQDESAETELDYIEWSCAASTISPVAVFRPVELEGTTVRRASLCNISECERLGIGDKGTRIDVIKANKIIPKRYQCSGKDGNFRRPRLMSCLQSTDGSRRKREQWHQDASLHQHRLPCQTTEKIRPFRIKRSVST